MARENAACEAMQKAGELYSVLLEYTLGEEGDFNFPLDAMYVCSL